MRFIPNKTAAAFELPPAIPAATGMCFSSVIFTPSLIPHSFIRRSAARYARLFSLTGR